MIESLSSLVVDLRCLRLRQQKNPSRRQQQKDLPVKPSRTMMAHAQLLYPKKDNNVNAKAQGGTECHFNLTK